MSPPRPAPRPRIAAPTRARTATLPALAAFALLSSPGARRATADDGDEGVPSYTCSPAPPASTMTVALGPDVSIAELATWLAGFTCESVVIAPDVAKHATRLQIIAPRPLTPRQAVKLFVASVEAAGLKVKHKDRTFTIALGPGMPRACPDVAIAGGPDGAPVELAPPLDADRLADKLAAAARKLDATHVEVPRALVDAVLANPEAFSRSARVLPAVKAGVVIGFKIYAVRPGSLFARLGLVNGDTITAIAGQPLDSLDHALDAYSGVRTASKVDVALVRRGTPMTLTITIVP